MTKKKHMPIIRCQTGRLTVTGNATVPLAASEKHDKGRAQNYNCGACNGSKCLWDAASLRPREIKSVLLFMTPSVSIFFSFLVWFPFSLSSLFYLPPPLFILPSLVLSAVPSLSVSPYPTLPLPCPSLHPTTNPRRHGEDVGCRVPVTY